MPIRVVLFDATGTLIATREPVGETYARVAHAHGAAISAWRLGEAFSRALAAAPPLAFPGAAPAEIDALERAWWHDRVRATFLSADSAVRPRDFERCFDTLFAHFARPAAWQLRPGALEALQALRRAGRRLGIVSNFDGRLRALLVGLGIADRFESVVLPSDCGAAKPSPVIFEHALRAFEVDAQECVFVGDDAERDLAGARALGLQTIDVGTLATLTELPTRIDRLEGDGDPARSEPTSAKETPQ